MGGKKIFEKLEKVNSKKDEIVFKMEYKGKIIHQKELEVPDYIQSIIDDEDMSFFYFFKDMVNKLEEKINEAHKKKAWDDLNNGKNDTGKSSKS